jgi:peptidoglycan hydrolase-like protein with peptidoglycan-binding domain
MAQPAQALETTLGPVSGLAALVRHLTVGDPESTIEPGARGPEVALVQSRLGTLGFRPGPIDGAYGGQTYSAVLALQKHEGLERTGLVDPITRAALDGLVAAGPRDDLLGDRIEIDLARQVIFLVVGEEVSVINTSTGNGEPYIRSNGATAIARTPQGGFAIGQRYDGNQVGFLGTLYRPMYFSGPYAIHGSGSVPGYPASHGCARTSFGDMDFLWTVIPGGMQVYSYD